MECNNFLGDSICNLGYACDACPYNNEDEIISRWENGV